MFANGNGLAVRPPNLFSAQLLMRPTRKAAKPDYWFWRSIEAFVEDTKARTNSRLPFVLKTD